jgi:FAD-dependent urate hydroxylase
MNLTNSSSPTALDDSPSAPLLSEASSSARATLEIAPRPAPARASRAAAGFTGSNFAIVDSKTRKSSCQVAVIGAGPYGLAAAAHLRAAGVETRIFGETLEFWRKNMPQEMRLRSPWRGSHIADPEKRFTLDRFAENGCIERVEPLPLEDFIKYGNWFQHQVLPDLDRRKVQRVDLEAGLFRLKLEDGELVYAKRVVMATGLAKQGLIPWEFQELPAALVSHSSEHSSFEAFRGKRVAVIGRGQSACESAAILSEQGAHVELISRGKIHWIGSENPGAKDGSGFLWNVFDKLNPPSPVGPLPLNWLADQPDLMRRLPDGLRRIVSAHGLRPAATAWLKPRTGEVQTLCGRTVLHAEAKGSRLAMHFDKGSPSTVDHVILATGFRVDISKQGILSPGLTGKIELLDGCPRLNAGLESSVTGLHFAGAAAVPSMGPELRFVWGAGYAARALTRRVLNRHR